MTKKRIIIGGIGLAMMLAAVYGWYQYNRATPGLADMPADYSVKATTLISEFVTNETGANTKYQNKVLSVNGTVKKIEGDGHTGIVVLGDEADMSSVRCQLDSTSGAMVSNLQPGKPITIKGAITGFNKDETGLLGSDVQLNRCVIATN
jgi:hypothetical protein